MNNPKLLFAGLLFFIHNFLSAQNKSTQYNQYNNQNQKHGYWQVYLDYYLNYTDSTQACYYAFTWYENGSELTPFQKRTKAAKRRFEFEGQEPTEGKPILLHGTFRFYYRNGNLEFEERYKRGKPELLSSYKWDKYDRCMMIEYLDYEKPYQKTPGTFFYELLGYDSEVLKQGYFRNGAQGWQIYFE